jgi:hypothetical protein
MCSLFVRVILGCKAEKLLFSDAAGAACLVMNTVLMVSTRDFSSGFGLWVIISVSSTPSTMGTQVCNPSLQQFNSS